MGCSVSLVDRFKTGKNSQEWPLNRLPRERRGWPTPKKVTNKLTPRNWTNINISLGAGGGSKPTSSAKSTDNYYKDEVFPACDESIFRKKKVTKSVVWKRPQFIHENASLISDGTSRHDMRQGDLNDCWFLSTLSAIAEKPQLISKIIPDDYSFDSPSYTGKFRCRFWQFGDWVDVFLDDRLPTVNGHLLFAHSSAPEEFWVSLVEKAYAKLNGSYESLEYGFEADAFTDMTGGLAEWYNPTELKHEDFYLIRAAFQSGAVIGCLSVDKEGQAERERRGMVSNHSYVVTGVEEVSYKEGTVKLVRVRNPWGDTEWQGAWSDGSDQWMQVTNDVKRELELTSQDDGEFWMSFDDFRKEYCNMIICNLSPDFDHDGISDKAEYQRSVRGRWKAGFNAGGWLECSTFFANPQYIITIYPDTSVQRRFSGRLPLVVSLLQVYRRQQKLDGIGLFAIGFEIFQRYSNTSGRISKSFFDQTDPLMPENEETYAEYRETSGRFFLDPGEYILVPTTQLPNQERSYLLRLFSVGAMECRPYDNVYEQDWDIDIR
ncbi:calpain-8-like [Mya arenaria]|uniref:calpain-8-like n=1 Tax=Mya arenaria TaxID=6604 RepID=UPI0022E1DE05|nr:calpain-8-like [Mya arenaria]